MSVVEKTGEFKEWRELRECARREGREGIEVIEKGGHWIEVRGGKARTEGSKGIDKHEVRIRAELKKCKRWESKDGGK